ncbi:MAG: hypothetical protein ACXVBI_11170 [Flavisolibacter sp.]
MRTPVLFFLFYLTSLVGLGQPGFSFSMYQDVRITIDTPTFQKNKGLLLIFYALPNGNTTEQTMGKKMGPGVDWHFDIQHIRAQTGFLREKLPRKNIVVIYLENHYRSWPLWKQKHPDYRVELPHLVDSITGLFPKKRRMVYLNGHSGGGSFLFGYLQVFGYLQGVKRIPPQIRRISFLDSDYGYDSSYYPLLRNWLHENKKNCLTVFAYNDSLALFKGQPLVSATGGTWYRSHLLLQDLEKDFHLEEKRRDSLIFWEDPLKKIGFFFKENPDRGIYHTQQVEYNGFIHSILFGTERENDGYRYYGPRAYTPFIQ